MGVLYDFALRAYGRGTVFLSGIAQHPRRHQRRHVQVELGLPSETGICWSFGGATVRKENFQVEVLEELDYRDESESSRRLTKEELAQAAAICASSATRARSLLWK